MTPWPPGDSTEPDDRTRPAWVYWLLILAGYLALGAAGWWLYTRMRG